MRVAPRWRAMATSRTTRSGSSGAGPIPSTVTGCVEAETYPMTAMRESPQAMTSGLA